VYISWTIKCLFSVFTHYALTLEYLGNFMGQQFEVSVAYQGK